MYHYDSDANAMCHLRGTVIVDIVAVKCYVIRSMYGISCCVLQYHDRAV